MAAQNFSTYSLKDSIIVLGAEAVSGFDEDDAITIEFPNEFYEAHRGCDGEWTRSEQPHPFEADVTISLGQKSKSNGAMMVQILLDKATNLATLPFSVINKDGTGGGAVLAYHQKMPDGIAYGRNAAPRQYKIKCPQFIPLKGGI